eukprot:m.128496 g.128496  ORF g.128496 m.128496 type:complete len:64 (+) comp13626_c1_seq1:1026-1217(+)
MTILMGSPMTMAFFLGVCRPTVSFVDFPVFLLTSFLTVHHPLAAAASQLYVIFVALCAAKVTL